MTHSLHNTLHRVRSLLASPHLAALAQPERLFLALALPFGFMFIFLFAPFQTPDEFVHFYRAYAISTGQWAGTSVSLPESVVTFSQTVSNGIAGNDQNKQSKKALITEFSRPFASQPLVEVSILNSAIVSPLPYLPQAFGILIGRLAHLHPIIIFYLGRIANFLAWLGLVFLAIRTTPLHRRLFMALALMPMTLQQAASTSPDAATIAISFLFIAFCLQVWMDQRTKIPWRDWAWIVLLVIALALCKSIYILAAGLLIPVVFRHFRHQRMILPTVLAVIVLGLVCGVAWLYYSSQFVSVSMMINFRLPTTAGIAYIVQHPLAAAPLIWSYTANHFGDQLRMFIGILGWIDTPLPTWVYPLYYALLLGVAIFEPHPTNYFKTFERLWIAFLAVLTSLVIMALFVYPESDIVSIDLAQGRYYIPLGAFYFLPLSQRKWSLAEESPAWLVFAVAHALVLLVAVRALLWRYYAI